MELRQLFDGEGCDKKKKSLRTGRCFFKTERHIFEDTKQYVLRHKDKYIFL